jgi:hypothetical protein
MSRQPRQYTQERDRRRKIAFIIGAAGFGLMLVAVQVLTLSATAAMVAGWVLLVWGIGAALWAVRELWETRSVGRR